MKTLVIVESAAKAKTIQKYLGSHFVVLASYGHICDIPVKEMGVDLRTWEATYVPVPGKAKVIAQLRKAVQEADAVLIASDPDLEGEAIASHLQRELRIPKAKRISFQEITKNALKEAIQNPRNVDRAKVAAQESRRILDRVVGYELSPLLWRRFATSGLSAGRVQSAALKMLVARTQQAQKHVATPYWELVGTFALPTLTGTAHGVMWEDETDLKKYMRSFHKRAWDVVWTATISMTESKQQPSAPFTTSSLQQEAYNRLGLPAKRTMQLAQGLYEHGFITYMRTDSTKMSEDAVQQIHGYIGDTFGDAMVCARTFKTKAANAQEAHEAVRPSNVFAHVGADGDITSTHVKLYDLIWRRAVASQMAPAVYKNVQFAIKTESISGVEFRGKHAVLVEEGYLKIYSPEQKATPEELCAWKIGTIVVRPQRFEVVGSVTRPAALYNEPLLVKALEKEGIGRPSTYAAIVDKLFSKGYVIKGAPPQVTLDVPTYRVKGKAREWEEEVMAITVGGKDADRMIPTSLGERVSAYVESVVPFLVDTSFTSEMEKSLDLIEEGKQTKKELLDIFYENFHKQIAVAQVQQKNSKKTETRASAPPPLREFTSIQSNVVQTRFGPALFVIPEKRFVSVTPFLEWKEKTLEQLTLSDVEFLVSLPKKVAGTRREIHIGRYGLYVKDGAKNIRLPKDMWEDVFLGRVDAKAIDELTARRGRRSDA